MPRFIINRQPFDIERSDALRLLATGSPGLVQRHYVEVGGLRWPLKEALSTLTRLDHREFTSQHAGRVMRALGFEVLQREPEPDPVEAVRRDLEAVLRRIDAALGSRGWTDAQVETLLDTRNKINEVIVLSRIQPARRDMKAGGQP